VDIEKSSLSIITSSQLLSPLQKSAVDGLYVLSTMMYYKINFSYYEMSYMLYIVWLVIITTANYIHLMAFFSRTTWVSKHQKGKTILYFNEARNDGVEVASAGPQANHLHLALHR